MSASSSCTLSEEQEYMYSEPQAPAAAHRSISSLVSIVGNSILPQRFQGFSTAKLSRRISTSMNSAQIANNARKRKHALNINVAAFAKAAIVDFPGGLDSLVVAAACNNSMLIIRQIPLNLSERSKTQKLKLASPVNRILKWYQEPQRQISAMCFSPDTRKLLCVSNDGVAHLISTEEIIARSTQEYYQDVKKRENLIREKAMLAKSSHAIDLSKVSLFQLATRKEKNSLDDEDKCDFQSTFLNSNDIREYKISPKPLDTVVSECIWWKTFQGEDFGIFGTFSGEIYFMNLSNEEVHSCTLKTPITKLEMIVDKVDLQNSLLIHTLNGGYYKLLMEEKIHGQFFTFPRDHHSQLKAFLPVPITRFSNDAQLSVQNLAQGPVISVYDPTSFAFELYPPSLEGYPLFVYFLPRGKMYHFTPKFTIVIGSENPADVSEQGILVISNLLSQHLVKNKPNPKSIFQFLQIPLITGVFCVDGLDKDCSKLFIWSNDSVFRFQKTDLVYKVLKKLIKGNLDPIEFEILGKTLGMDLDLIYEIAANEAFSLRRYEIAASLYALSNTRVVSVIKKFLQADKASLPFAIKFCCNALYSLHVAKELSDDDRVKRKKLYSKLLGKCLMKLSQLEYSDSEFLGQSSQVIEENAYYDAETMLHYLVKNGKLDLALLVSNKRDLFFFLIETLVICNKVSFLTGDNLEMITTADRLKIMVRANIGKTFISQLNLSGRIFLLNCATKMLSPISLDEYLSKNYNQLLLDLDHLDHSRLLEVANYLDTRNLNDKASSYSFELNIIARSRIVLLNLEDHIVSLDAISHEMQISNEIKEFIFLKPDLHLLSSQIPSSLYRIHVTIHDILKNSASCANDAFDHLFQMGVYLSNNPLEAERFLKEIICELPDSSHFSHKLYLLSRLLNSFSKEKIVELECLLSKFIENIYKQLAILYFEPYSSANFLHDLSLPDLSISFLLQIYHHFSINLDQITSKTQERIQSLLSDNFSKVFP